MNSLHLSSLIDMNLLFLKYPGVKIEDIYDFMVTNIGKNYQLAENRECLLKKLINRRLDEGILLPTGIAIPHLHLENFNDTVISVLIPEREIVTEFGEVKIFFMVFNGQTDNSLYLKIMQSLIKLSKDEEFFKKLLAVKSAHDFVSHLKTGDFAVKKAVTVSDIMSRRFLTVNKSKTLKELSTLFYENNFSYFPVVDDENRLVGEITILDYIMSGFPEYTNFLNNLSFLKNFEPFESLVKEEHLRKIESVMKPIEVTLKAEDSLFEAIFLMNKYKRRDIPVMEKGKLIGIISFIDIFRKVIKA